jgi:hypothetical protein
MRRARTAPKLHWGRRRMRRGGMMHFDSCLKASTTQRFCAFRITIAAAEKSLDMYATPQ